MASEESPLIGNQLDENSRCYEVSEDLEPERPPICVTVPLFATNEQPPPYSLSPHEVHMASCEVCGFMIDISGKQNQRIVKCSRCNEVTPIRKAISGKRYVRCPCHCLLVCNSSSSRVSCPRSNCKRILNLEPIPEPENPPVSNVPGICKLSCAHCHTLFMFIITIPNVLARCPHCRKVSTVERRFARMYGCQYLAWAFVWLISALGITFGNISRSDQHSAFYCISLGINIVFYIMFLCCTAKAVFYFTLKISNIVD